MKTLLQICFVLCFISSAAAQEPLRHWEDQYVLHTYDWSDLLQQHPVPNSQIVSLDGISVLKIENTNGAPMEATLLSITDPATLRHLKYLSFDEKQENVLEGAGFSGFKTVVYIPPEVLGGDGNTNGFDTTISGTHNWGLDRLPIISFFLTESAPIRVDFKFYLATSGTVYLRPLKLLGTRSTWWSPQQSALMGGIGGSLIGCFGALIGILAGLGKARRFVLSATGILIVVGILLVVAGIIAVAMNQPYAVWYPLLLGGTILTFVLSINFYSINKRYEDMEIRRMTSMDASGS